MDGSTTIPVLWTPGRRAWFFPAGASAGTGTGTSTAGCRRPPFTSQSSAYNSCRCSGIAIRFLVSPRMALVLPSLDSGVGLPAEPWLHLGGDKERARAWRDCAHYRYRHSITMPWTCHLGQLRSCALYSRRTGGGRHFASISPLSAVDIWFPGWFKYLWCGNSGQGRHYADAGAASCYDLRVSSGSAWHGTG